MTINKIRKRQAQQRRKQKRNSYLVFLLTGIAMISLFGIVFWQRYRPYSGVRIQVPQNWQDHLPEGTNPGPFTSNPPSSGNHYGADFPQGFYEVNDHQTQLPYPEGYLLHNLEHGYVVFWYNCELLDDASCLELKTQIKDVMEKENNDELIAFPWNSTHTPLVMTSWGYLLEMDEFDESIVRRFIRTNRNRSPESHAD